MDQHWGQTMPWRYAPHEGKLQWVYQGLPHGNCQHWQPTDSLALHHQEARVHAKCMNLFSIKCSSLATSTADSSIEHRSCPQRKRKQNKSFSRSQWCMRRQTKRCPRSHFGSWLSNARLRTKQPVSLTSSRRRNSQRRRKRLIFLLLAAVVWTTGSIVARIATTIQATGAITMNGDTIVATKMIDAMTTLIMKRRTSRKSPTRIEIWSQSRSLQKDRGGHAQWPFLLFECGHFVQKKESLLVCWDSQWWVCV